MKPISLLVAVQLLMSFGSCQCAEEGGKWALPNERLDSRAVAQDPIVGKAVTDLVSREWPGSTIDFWNDRGMSWDVRVVYVKITTKGEERLVGLSYANQTKEAKIERSLFVVGGIASREKMTKADAEKLTSACRGIAELSGFVPAFFYRPGEDDKDADELPLGTWGYVIGEKEVVDRAKGQAHAEVYLSKDFAVIDHRIVGSIE